MSMQEAAVNIIKTLENKDHAFTITVRDRHWYVYRYGPGPVRGTIAFSFSDDKQHAIIGLLDTVELTKEQCIEHFESEKPD